MAAPAKQPASKKTIRRPTQEPLNKHQVKTDQMRSKLLKSARRLFARDGFEAAKLEDIAKDAGHTRGAFYAHFESKEELFLALLEQQISLHLERVQALIDAETSRESKLKVLRQYYVGRLADSKWCILMLEFKLFAVRHPRGRARLAAAHRAMKLSLQVKDICDLLTPGTAIVRFSDNALKVVLDSFLQCLVLQRIYDPVSFSSTDASQALGRVFDVLVSSK